MTFEDYYRDNVTYISRVDPRLAKIIELTTQRKPSSTLDIGCGRGFLLGHLAQRGLSGLAGLDVYDDVSDPRFDYIRADVTQPFPIADASYELVIAGEIIEHVPNPDDFLREIRRVVTPGGTVIISTPNLVSWANRVLVPFGVQPLGTSASDPGAGQSGAGSP